jgi:hypothetical protein
LGVNTPGERAALAAALALLERKIETLLAQTPAPADTGAGTDPWADDVPGSTPSLALRNGPRDERESAMDSETKQGSVATAAPEPAPDEMVTTINFQDPDFRANAYALYEELRAQGPVSKVRRLTGREDEEGERALPRTGLFARESNLVTHYDEGVAAMLDDRFTVDPAKVMSPEEQEAVAARMADAPRISRALSRNLLTLNSAAKSSTTARPSRSLASSPEAVITMRSRRRSAGSGSRLVRPRSSRRSSRPVTTAREMPSRCAMPAGEATPSRSMNSTANWRKLGSPSSRCARRDMADHCT